MERSKDRLRLLAVLLSAVMVFCAMPREAFAGSVKYAAPVSGDEETALSEDGIEEAVVSENGNVGKARLNADGDVGGGSGNFPGFTASYSHTYTANAGIINKAELPGVYSVKAVKGDNKSSATLGIPSIAKQNLQSAPTTESPAIIQGAAVPFEKRVCDGSKIEFEKISDKPICAPYTEFRYSLIEEANANGNGTHTKISGFDGTYVIVRVDVSDLIKDAPEGSYLHMISAENKAMLTAVGMQTADGRVRFIDNTGTVAGCYALSQNAAALKDKDGLTPDTPYVDIIMMSSGTIVAGADKGTSEAVSADFPISFYVDQTSDYDPSIEWDAATGQVRNVETREVIADQKSGGTVKTAQSMILDKYYNEAKAKEAGLKDADITSYVVKGDDLELEVMVDETIDDTSTEKEYWSLRRAMDYQKFNKHTIRLMLEVPVLEGLIVEDTEGVKDREVVLDVNSFDIQIANHKDKDLAGLTVKNATLTIKDDSNTTGAELAVGNNASMSVIDNGKLVIDRTCQVEVEYDAASISAGSVPKDDINYKNGVLTVENGGEIVNNGVITVEGKEGKAEGADAGTITRDYKDARLTIGERGTLTNNGCVLVNGSLYNYGTIVNNGSYEDAIVSVDPDKGSFTYHRGMQLSWKDDITQGKTIGGILANGVGNEGKRYPDAVFVNNGDLVLIPGYIYNYATLKNNGNVFMTAVDEVVIPITASQDAPTVTEERINLGYPEGSYFQNYDGALIENTGSIRTADFEITSNGRTGDKKSDVSPYFEEMILSDWGGKIINSGNGVIALSDIATRGEVQNTGKASMKGTFSTPEGQKEVTTRIRIGSSVGGHTGSYRDSSAVRSGEVFNASKTAGTGEDIWTYTKLKSLAVTPAQASVGSGDTVKWTLHAEPEKKGEGIQYLIQFSGDNTKDKYVVVSPDKDTEMESPAAPASKCNLVYNFIPMDGGGSLATAVLRVNDATASKVGVVRPTAMQDLVYNGEEQPLVTAGYTTEGILQYSLDGGAYSTVRPTAKNAGTYQVSYRVVTSESSATVLDPGGSVSVAIAKRPLYLAADDKGSKAGDPIKELTYTAYGIMPADKESLGITLTTAARTGSAAGSYPIKLTWKGSSNYEFENADGSSRISDGTYYVTEKYLNMTVSSNFQGYRNMNEAIGVIAKYKRDETKTTETLCTIYYSDKKELNETNYKTDGVLSLKYAAVGTDKRVYYYVAEAGISGSQRVVIIKGDQQTPGMKPTGALTAVSDHQTKGGSSIEGFEPRKMEYRSADSDTYTRAVHEKQYVAPGTWYVRRMGDSHYNPSPDTEVYVPEPGSKLTVSFNANGGTLRSPASVSVNYGDTIEKPADPERESLKFAGWLLEGDYGVHWDFSWPLQADLKLKADWDTIKYKVSYDSDGGTAVIPEAVEKDQKATKPADPSRAGYDFLGWRLNGAAYSFDSPVTGDITLKAEWKAHEYTVAFDANGGSGSMAPMQFKYDEEKDLTKNSYVKEGSVFSGWNDKADGTGKDYRDMQSIINLTTGDGEVITLYAHWKKTLKSPDISILLDGTESLKYTGKELRPNVTVTDGDTDITRYCRLTYSDNVNAGTGKVTIAIVGSNPRYSDQETAVKEFVIGKGTYTPAFGELNRSYLYSEDRFDVLDLTKCMTQLPVDRGATEYTVSWNGDVSYSDEPAPVVQYVGDTGQLLLSYSVKKAAKEGTGRISVKASMQNYTDTLITVNVRQTGSVLYIKDGKDYHPFGDTVITGKSYQLGLMTPTGAVTKNVTWKSSDDKCVKVSKSGKISVKKTGNATITASAGSETASCDLTVKQAVKKVVLSRKSYPMGVGESVTLKGETQPAEAGQLLGWSVNKTGFASVSVNADGSVTVKALKKGSLKLTAMATDGSKKKASCSISIGDPVTGLTVQGKGNKKILQTGGRLGMQVKWEGKPKNKQVIWKLTRPDGTSASDIAEINSKGVLTGKKEGSVRVTAVSVANPEKSAYTDIDVYVPVKKVALSKTKLVIENKDSSVQLDVTVTAKTAGLTATGETLYSEPVVEFDVDPRYAGKLVIEKKGSSAVITAANGAAPAKNIPVKVTVKAFNGYKKTLTCRVTVK